MLGFCHNTPGVPGTNTESETTMTTTNTKSKTETSTTGVTTKWGNQDAEVLAGADLVNKAELEGVPFRMTGFKFTHNDKSGIGYVYIEFETEPNGDRKQFNDASTGVRQQMEAYCDARQLKPALEEWVDVSIVAPRGLRVSEYDTTDERGKPTRGRTFYLTTSGGRA